MCARRSSSESDSGPTQELPAVRRERVLPRRSRTPCAARRARARRRPARRRSCAGSPACAVGSFERRLTVPVLSGVSRQTPNEMPCATGSPRPSSTNITGAQWNWRSGASRSSRERQNPPDSATFEVSGPSPRSANASWYSGSAPRMQRNRLLRGPDAADLDVVLQVAPDLGQVEDRLDLAQRRAPPRGRSRRAAGAAASCMRPRRGAPRARRAARPARRRARRPRRPRACLRTAGGGRACASRPSGSAARRPGAGRRPRSSSACRRAGSPGSGRRRPGRRR